MEVTLITFTLTHISIIWGTYIFTLFGKTDMHDFLWIAVLKQCKCFHFCSQTIAGLQAGLHVSPLPVLYYLLVLQRVVEKGHREVWLYRGPDGGTVAAFNDTGDTAICSIW